MPNAPRQGIYKLTGLSGVTWSFLDRALCASLNQGLMIASKWFALALAPVFASTSDLVWASLLGSEQRQALELWREQHRHR